MINNAEEFNDPGEFTAFIAFEWTSLVKGANMHRNVIFPRQWRPGAAGRALHDFPANGQH